MEKEVIISVLQKMKDELSKNDHNVLYVGICKVAYDLRKQGKLDPDLHDFIYDYLIKNKPTPDNQYKEFTQNQYWITEDSAFWWNTIHTVPETRQIRIDYLTKLIDNVK